MRRKKKLYILLTFLVLGLVLFGLVKILHGRVFYFTTGLDKNELMVVGDKTTYTFEANILMSDAKKEYEEMFGKGIWDESVGDSTFDKYIMDQIRVKLIRVQMMNSMAKEKGVVLGREELNAVHNAADKYFDGISLSDAEKIGASKEKIREMFEKFAIAQKLYNDLISVMNIEVSSDEARVIDIQYIVSESKEVIDDAYKKVSTGSSFFAVAKECNKDGQYEYELKRGEMNADFEKTAYNLSTGEMSGVIEADGKYYIIRCTSDNDKTKTEVNKSAILSKKQLEQFNKDFEEYESKIYVEWNDKAWDTLNIKDVKVYSMRFDDLLNSCVENK